MCLHVIIEHKKRYWTLLVDIKIRTQLEYATIEIWPNFGDK